MTITENLFLSISKILNIRVTPDNLRTNMDAVASNGGITGKVKTDILREFLIAFAELETKIDELKPTKITPTV